MGDGIFILVILIYALIIFALSKISNDVFEYRNYLIVKNIEKFSLPFFFSILSIVSCFIKFEYWITYIVFILFNIFSLIYFFYDYFYLQQYEKEYINELQNKCLVEKKISDLFDIKETTASYECIVVIEWIKGYSITKSEYGECIQFKGTGNSILFVPKEKMSRIKLKHCMKELSNVNKETINVYPDGFNDEMYNRFIYWEENRIYHFLKKITKNKIIKILLILIYILLFIIVLLFFLDHFNVIDLEAIINLKI